MQIMGKWMILSGVILVILGIILYFVPRLGIPLGKLPGDIIVRRENFTFYFPLVTSILASVFLSLVFYLISRFR